MIEVIGAILKFIFTFILYPIVVIGVFLTLVGHIYIIIMNEEGSNRIRRFAAALLPVVGLIFSLVLIDTNDMAFESFFQFFNNVFGLLIGLVIGAGILFLGGIFADKEREIEPALFVLFLSLVCVFILFSIMVGVLGSLNYFLFGIVIGGIIYIIIFGPPKYLYE